MLTRRTLLAGTMAMPGLPNTGALRFRLIRKGADIGLHVLQFRRIANGVAISIVVDIAVRFGPFVVYHYRLQGSETWGGGRCVAASSRTNNDGKSLFMRASRGSDGLRVEGTDVPPYVAPEDALIASHWNRAELRGPWINLQDGRLLHPHVTSIGSDPVLLADGKRTPATGYVITGPARIWLWYSPTSVWTGLVFEAKDGSRVRYERLT